MKEVKINDEILKAVLECWYLGDLLFAGDGFELAVVTRCNCSWGNFCQLLPLSINCNLLVLTCGSMYSTCVISVMLHAAETWAMTVVTLKPLRRIDGSVISRQRMNLAQTPFSQSLVLVTWTSRMRWFRHVERSTGWIAEVVVVHVYTLCPMSGLKTRSLGLNTLGTAKYPASS